MHRWLKHYGFALLVLASLACASFLAGGATVPEPIPDYALQSEEIYRLEIGAAFFVAFYLALMALMLALGGKGFAEFGARGLRAATVVSRQKQLDRHMLKKLDSVPAALGELERRIELLGQRLESLEDKR
ncbi:MAG: hypothetical protein M3Y75_02500 [Actinomycetota bacterium]|nr:hypothetical protein [Actinomycetota bacterium]